MRGLRASLHHRISNSQRSRLAGAIGGWATRRCSAADLSSIPSIAQASAQLLPTLSSKTWMAALWWMAEPSRSAAAKLRLAGMEVGCRGGVGPRVDYLEHIRRRGRCVLDHLECDAPAEPAGAGRISQGAD